MCCAVCGAFSQAVPQTALPFESLVEPTHAEALRHGGVSVNETQVRNPALKLLPNHTELRQFVTDVMNALSPNIAVETLHLYKKPAASEGWNSAQRAGLFNQILSLSTLTGIEYFSASRNAMRTFYESSVVIDGPESKRQLPDPVFGYPPEAVTVYARQKDLTFGDNIYRYDFVTTQDAFFFTQENLTPLNAGIIPAVGKNKLRSVMAIVDCGDSLLIYAVSMAKTAALPGMVDRIGNSFGNRAEAVLKWFTARADKVFS